MLDCLSPSTIPRQLLTGLGWGILAAAAVLVLAIAGPLAFGARPHTVLTGSMEPTIAAGDVVIDEQVSPTAVSVGDVVTFRDPEEESKLITHRVTHIRPAGTHLWFTTQGDANNTFEHWRIPADGELGRVAYTVPWVGHVAVLTHTPLGLAVLVIVPLLLLALEELTRIWRPREGEAVGETP